MNLGVVLNRVFRINDNPLFHYIAEHNEDIEQLAVIIPIENMDDVSNIKKQYYYNVVGSFVSVLKQCNIQPYIIKYNQLADLCQNLDLTHVLMPKDIMSFNNEENDYPHISADLKKHDIQIIGLRVNHYLQPTLTFNKQNEPYKVFTSFYKANRSKIINKPSYSYELTTLSKLCSVGSNKTDITFDENQNMEQQSNKAWQDFFNNDIEYYSRNRDDVAQSYVSGMSIDLAYGLLDIAMVMNDLLEHYPNDEENYEAYIRELMFREFYYVLMTQFPNTAQQSFNEKYRKLNWSYNKAHFKAWTEGKTGYPLVDAAMRKLNRTGHMHNRLRMVVSQFLTKDLFIDWTWGEAYFKKYLIDYDNASNVHGWQWSASTGTDAVPYFRMFNPSTQGERFDKNAYFIKEELPIFDDVPAKYIHHPMSYEETLRQTYGIELGKDYPKAIVDHKISREHVMTKFKNVGK
ncbi:cryptochrome/photolyase family protein [Staphylococcus kloosii]|jgi:deoxyribodipyrimidine photo-lyase|uniref:cryptochrome/photolyase family protein n=1 Tax=Staphylococcus kloosii TaxID=29384 RepID=UPI00189C70B8|nr:deoxyribodipyrimidine photo-lyase [Staphylococcus kloosii]MBF7025197.1 deoxyribodipyrimidine photo-lyase [Staphylococcus kloosii]